MQEDTARQLFSAAPTPHYSAYGPPPPQPQQQLPPPPHYYQQQQQQQPQQYAAPPPQQHQPQPTASGHAEEEAEAALQYLEAEWAIRMEAPLSALGALEENVSRAIDAAILRLPQSA